MDWKEARELSLVANAYIESAKQYQEYRKASGQAEMRLKILLASQLKELRLAKKNLGVEMAMLILMEDNMVARGLYEEWQDNESKYKAMEKLLDAYGSKLSMEQSVMKYLRAEVNG